jgi:hypothetical protein
MGQAIRESIQKFCSVFRTIYTSLFKLDNVAAYLPTCMYLNDIYCVERLPAPLLDERTQLPQQTV